MAVLSESVRSNLRISYGEDEDAWNSTMSRLNTEADADSLVLLVEAISVFQGVEPAELACTNEYILTQA